MKIDREYNLRFFLPYCKFVGRGIFLVYEYLLILYDSQNPRVKTKWNNFEYLLFSSVILPSQGHISSYLNIFNTPFPITCAFSTNFFTFRNFLVKITKLKFFVNGGNLRNDAKYRYAFSSVALYCLDWKIYAWITIPIFWVFFTQSAYFWKFRIQLYYILIFAFYSSFTIIFNRIFSVCVNFEMQKKPYQLDYSKFFMKFVFFCLIGNII